MASCGVDLNVVGWIRTVLDALGLIVTTLIWGGRRGDGPTTTLGRAAPGRRTAAVSSSA
jgi:hypothetical protein